MELPKNLGLAKLPPHLEIAVYLLKAELKNRKFIKCLEQVGFDNSLCALDFSSLIMKLIGFDMDSDDKFEFYNDRLEAYVQDIDIREDDDNLNKIAFDFYLEIEAEKKRIQKKG
jgi:hypothetical protein